MIMKSLDDIIKELIDNIKKSFDEEIIEQVNIDVWKSIEGKIRKAYENSKERSENNKIFNQPVSYDWDHYGYECRVCKNIGMLAGHTEILSEEDEEGKDIPGLIFIPESFKCPFCMLSLNDYEELFYAGMDKFCNRTNEIKEWIDEFGIESYVEHLKQVEWIKDLFPQKDNK
jgi:hypothetical protein